MREGLHAVHLAQFVVLTEDEVAAGPGPAPEKAGLEDLRRKLVDVDGFAPVVVGVRSADEEKRDGEKGKEEPCLPETPSGTLGVVTVHDGPPADGSRRPHREDREDRLDVEDPEGFLAGGGRRGKQRRPLTDGVYWVNRWFATVDLRPHGRSESRRTKGNGRAGWRPGIVREEDPGVALRRGAAAGRGVRCSGARPDGSGGFPRVCRGMAG